MEARSGREVFGFVPRGNGLEFEITSQSTSAIAHAEIEYEFPPPAQQTV